jgi:hypothetical protein
MVRKLSWIFGVLVGIMGTAMFMTGNLFGTPIFAHLRGLHPYLFRLPWPIWFIEGGIASLALAGVITACRTRSLMAAIRVGTVSGLIGSSILFMSGMGMTIVFHDAMMKDPGNVHEYLLSSPEAPTEGQLSNFLYMDALAGALNMMWITPLAGAILGSIGGGTGMLLILLTSHLLYRKRFEAGGSSLSMRERSSLPVPDPL